MITFREIAAQLGVEHHTVQEMMEILGYRKFVPVGFPVCLGVQRNPKRLGTFSHPPYSPDLASSYYHLLRPLKDHLRSRHYKTDEAVLEVVRSSLRGAETDFYRRGMFKILQRWQKCIDRDGDFVEN
jgi:hypothetical protein